MKHSRIKDAVRVINVQRNYCNKDFNERIADFPSTYNWNDADRWYSLWEKNKYFPRKVNSDESFKMILPPPNVTGVLHLGHALTCTIQDILARWHRMKNTSVIWVPGLDHAGIATQAVVEKYLYTTKSIGRYDLDRDEFLSHIEEWKKEKGDNIKNQLKALGASLDWDKEYFTMSKEHNKAVTEAFVILSKRKLLYRSKALINWSPTLRSTISEMEIDYVRVEGKTDFSVPGYKRKVPFGQIAQVACKIRDSEEEIMFATTRVETMPGDVAIAVHPDDPRYSRYIGREVWHPIRRKFIPIIEDSSVKIEFGTGAVKITPAHDHLDLAIAKRYDLEIIDVIGNDGKIITDDDALKGLDRFVAREKILNELTRQGALKSLDNHEMLVPVCSRTGDVVEYLIREQWFAKTKNMAERAIEAVTSGKLKIDPSEWTDIWCDWLSSNRDWCVSRQIFWGHRIPAYRYQDASNNEAWIVARSEDEARKQLLTENPEYKNTKLKQDEDVLDTWFSSALLPLSAMGWPNREFEKNYPLSLMETGHDIIFLWVARMVMLGLELTNTLPFKEVLFHGVVCDAQGKKMSKSRGNVIRPEHVINGVTLKELNELAEESWKTGILSKEEYKRTLGVNSKMFPDGIPDCGADALRLTLSAHNVKNNRISFNVIECRTNKHFCNKIWQATKYILRMTDENPVKKPERLTLVDRWILSRLSVMVKKVNEAFEERLFYKAVQAVKQFFYYEFCDFFLEATKPGFRSDQQEIVDCHRYTLTRCLETSLRILAPIMPHLTDDLYSRCAKKLPFSFLSLTSLLEAPYPTYSGDLKEFRDIDLEHKFDRVLNVIFAIRNIVAQVNKKSGVEVHLVADTSEDYDNLMENVNLITAVTRVQNIDISPASEYQTKQGSLMCNINGFQCRVFLVLLNESDVDVVKEKMEKKRLQTEKKLNILFKSTSQPKYQKKPDWEKLRDQENIKNLQEELEKFPTFI